MYRKLAKILALVAVVLAAGCPPQVNVEVPDAIGMTRSEAEAAITAAGLEVAVVEEESDTVPAGEIIRQEPAAGVSLAPGGTVQLVISSGAAPDGPTVPNLVGLTRAAAEAAIAAAGLPLGTVTEEFSASVPEGEVIRQDPAAGTDATPTTAVSFVISTGPEPVTVPNMVGSVRSAAEFSLTSAGFVIGDVTLVSSETAPLGQVISQYPEAGTLVEPGSTVSLVVSAGREPITVPDVVGLARATAESTIKAAGLNVGPVTEIYHDTVPAGSVASQNPFPDTEVAPGARVTLIVSIGAQPVTVPDVVGATQSDAEVALLAVGLRLGAVTGQNSSTIPEGQVISQNPAAGATVPRTSAIALVVSLGPVQLTVPNVTGLSQASAESAIEAAGLTVGSVTTEFSATVPEGDVISQDPASGTVVLEGAVVTLVVSDGPNPGQVTAMIGSPGGTIGLRNIEAEVPAGALDETLTFTLERDRTGARVDLGPNETALNDIHTLTQSDGAAIATLDDPFAIELAFDAGAVDEADLSRTAVYLRVTTATGSFRVMGSVSGNGLRVDLAALPESADFRVVVNTKMRRAVSEAAGAKVLTQNPPWDTTRWECFYDPSLSALRQAVAAVRGISTANVTDEIVAQVMVASVANNARDGGLYYEDLGLRQPDLLVSTVDSAKFMTLQVDALTQDSHALNNTVRYGQLYVDAARIDDPVSHALGSVRASIAHDVFHACFNGYNFNTSAITGPASLGYDEGLAAVLGHTLDSGAIAVRAAAVHKLSQPVGNPGALVYENNDWFAYIGKRFDTDSLTYVGGHGTASPGVSNGLVESMRGALAGQNLASQDAVLNALRGAMHDSFEAQFSLELGEMYWDYARNRAYERNDESRLRAADAAIERYTLDTTLFDTAHVISRTMSSENETLTVSHADVPALVDVPPLSSRVVIFTASGFSSDVTITVNSDEWTPDEHGNSVLAKAYKEGLDGLEPGEDGVHFTGFGLTSDPNTFNSVIVLLSNVSVDQTYSLAVTAITSPATLPTGGIRGRVVVAGTSTPISAVAVEARANNVFTGDPIGTDSTDGNGQYTVLDLPASDVELMFDKSGYIPTHQSARVLPDFTTQIAETLMVPITGSPNGSASGQVIDATTGSGIPGALLNLRAGMLQVHDTDSDIVASVSTDSNGDYVFSDIAAGVYTVFASKAGYLSGVFVIYIIGGESHGDQDGDLSPNVAAGQVRIILTWGQTPSDLDSHLTGPTASGSGRFHIFFADRIEAGHADLDLDDVTSFGPETTTIHNLHSGTYRYSVHDYTNLASTTSTAMSNSGANVRVISGAGVTEFNITPNTPATLWTVFEIDGETGMITPKDEYTFESNPDAVDKSLGGHYGLGAETPTIVQNLPAKE